MLARIQAMWRLLTRTGSAARLLTKLNLHVRYCVLSALEETTLFAYLKEPHTLEEIREHLGFLDDDFTTYVFEVLANPQDGVLKMVGDRYQLDPARPIPTREEIERTTPPEILAMTLSNEQGRYVVRRMHGEPVTLQDRVVEQRESLMNFDDNLGSKIYDEGRIVSYLWARPLIGDPTGKRMLDIGCGSGREVPRLWLLLDGKVKITAIDPLPAFVEMSRERFPHYVEELSDGVHPPITEAVQPEFAVMGGTDLQFPDETFDIVFHSGTLHWTPNEENAIKEIARVLKPGGVVFGSLAARPRTSGFIDLTIRVNETAGGVDTEEDLLRWHRENGIPIDELIAGVFRAQKQT